MCRVHDAYYLSIRKLSELEVYMYDQIYLVFICFVILVLWIVFTHLKPLTQNVFL